MFDSQTLKKLEYLSLVSRKEFVGQTSGARRNAKLGGGVEFADYRNYVFGDDLRNLDWNVYARFESLFIKRFQEEGDLPVYCLLDTSRSMGASADDPKFIYAKRLAGALAYISLNKFDSVCVVACSDHAEQSFPLARGKERFLELASFLEKLQPSGSATNLRDAVRDVMPRLRKPGLAILISDCYDPNGIDDSLEQILARRFEPIVLQIYTQEEAQPQTLGDLEFVDVESGRRQKFAVDDAALAKYRARFQAFLAQTRASCVKRNARYYATSIDTPFDAFLLNVTRDVAFTR
ncbi:MAG: DUF58 domain-containing protein [Planctomycetia bacterium]|nr:DUF58 domain-containing protein [Planctomycetia bacterium]